jgi:hypothetical protein
MFVSRHRNAGGKSTISRANMSFEIKCLGTTEMNKNLIHKGIKTD